MHQIEVNNITIDVVRKNIKHMHLAVYPPTGRVRIAVPLRIDDDSIRLFAISKLAWIKKNQRNFGAQERQSPRTYIERESHYFQGKRYLLRIHEENSVPKILLKGKTYLDLYVRPNSNLEQRMHVLNEWYRSELKKQLKPIIEKWEKILKVLVDDWQVKQMKTKWGTCNIEKKRIWINLELAKKPSACLEYIVVHEMIHLLERHHNDNFLFYMDKYLPNWKLLKSELNNSPVSHSDWNY